MGEFELTPAIIYGLLGGALTFIGRLIVIKLTATVENKKTEMVTTTDMDRQAREFVVKVMDIQSQKIDALTAELGTLHELLQGQRDEFERRVQVIEADAQEVRELFNQALEVIVEILNTEEGTPEREVAIDKAQQFIQQAEQLRFEGM